MNDETLPFDESIERKVLGTIINYPDRYAEVAGWLRPEHFYRQTHRKIYEGIEGAADDNDSTSLLSVRAWMVEHGVDIDDDYLTEVANLDEVTISKHAVDIEGRAETLLELHARRGLMQEYSASWRRLKDGEYAEDVAGDVEQTTDELLDQGSDDRYDIVDYCRDHDRLVAGEEEKYYDTGIDVFDNVLCGGIALSRFYLLLALSGHGKSRVATAIAAGLMTNHDFAVDWWYVDGHERDVYDQFVSHMGPVHSSYLDHPQMVSEQKREALEERKYGAAGVIKGWEQDDRFRIFAEGEPDARQIKMETKRRAAQLDCPYMVVVDYIQRVDAGFEGERADYKNVRRAVRTLNDLKSLDNTAILGLGQFNRSASKGGMPKLRQARGSSQIEDDANHALIWHRPAQEEDSGDGGPSEQDLRFGRLKHAKSKHTDQPDLNVYADLARLSFAEWRDQFAQRMVRQDREEGWL